MTSKTIPTYHLSNLFSGQPYTNGQAISADPTQYVSESGYRLSVSGDQVEGIMEVVRLSEHFAVIISDLQIKTPHEMIFAGEDLLCLQYSISGECTDKALGYGAYGTRESTCTAIAQSRAINSYRSVPNQETWQSVAFSFHPGALHKLFGFSGKLLPGWVQKAASARNAAFDICQIKFNIAMNQVTRALLDNDFTGELRYAYIKAKTLELLCITFKMMQANNSHAAHSGDDIKKAEYVRQILDQQYNKNHTLEELARSAGTNRSTLAADFKRIFGMTIRQYQTGKRMELAQQLLYTPTLSIKAITEQVGYVNASSFSRAFKEWYGISPKALRHHK